MTVLRGCREGPVVGDLHRERRPRQGDDDLDEVRGRPRRRSCSSTREQRERGSEGECEREQGAVQEAAWYVRFGLWYCAKQAKAPGGVVRPFWPRDLARLTVRADVAELVDAHGSGPCGSNPVEVQVLSSA